MRVKFVDEERVLKKVLTLVIIFMLTAPTLSVLLPKVEADRTIENVIPTFESLLGNSASGIGRLNSGAGTSQNEHQVVDDSLFPLAKEVYIDMEHTDTADYQYDFDSTIELYVDVDASPDPRTVDVFTYLQTPNDDTIDGDSLYGWVVQGTTDDIKWFYMDLGFEYMDYVGLNWHIEILVRDSSTYVLLDQKKVFLTIGPILKEHFTCRDYNNPYGTKTTIFYDTDEKACEYTLWDTHNLWITWSVKYKFYGPMGEYWTSDWVNIPPGYYGYWTAAWILIRDHTPAYNPGSWYVDVLLEGLFRARDGFDILATTESVTVDPNGGRIYVDDNPITSLTVYSWSSGSTHTLDPDSGYSPSDGRRLVFTQWSDGSTADPRTITVSGSATYTAQWQTQYRLIVDVSPSGGGTTNPAVGTYWYDSGYSQIVSESPNSGYIFDHWDLDGSNVGSGTSYTVTMNDRHTLTAVFSVLVPDFDISISPSTLTIDQGKSDTATITVEQINGYSYDVSLSASGQPSGVTITFSPDHGTPTFASTMTIQVGYDVAPNTYSITISGIGSDSPPTTHSETFDLTITKIDFLTDPRLQVSQEDYDASIFGVAVSFTLYGITKSLSTSNQDYRSAVYQHLGISLTGDFQNEYIFMFEIYGICDLAEYLQQQWWSSWIFTSDFVSYIYSQHDTDEAARLAWTVRYTAADLQITITHIGSLCIDLAKMLYGKYTDLAIKNALNEFLKLISENPIESGLYQMFLTSPLNTKTILNFNTVVIGQWLQEVSDFLDNADLYLQIIIIGFKLCKIIWNFPVSLVWFVIESAIGIADCLINLYFHDYVPEWIANVVHIAATWCDPPEVTADIQVFSMEGQLLLGWNSSSGDFVEYSTTGFIMCDNATQIVFMKKEEPASVGVATHGSEIAEIPYTLSIVDDYGNKSYLSSGFLSTNQSVNMDMDFVDNVTEFGNHLIVETNVSTTTPIQGQPLTVNIAVNDTAGPYVDATVTLLINNVTWMTADNLGYGQYQTIVDTSSLVGLIPILVYADYPSMTTGYDAVILNVSSAIHNVAIASVTPIKTIVGAGYNNNINITIENQGTLTENFNVTVYANTTVIQTKTVTLTGENFTTITFTWNTAGFDKGNYTISANASIVLGETDLDDNTYTDGWVIVTRIGDVNGDGSTNVIDIILCCINMGSVPPRPPECDVNGDGTVDIIDILLCCTNMG